MILRIIFGLLFALFIPGFLLALIFFKELELIEKIALGFVLSICVDIFLGLFLGYNETMKNLTGGITAFNVWVYLSIITLMLFAIYIYKEREEALKFLKRLLDKRKKN